MQDTWGVLWIFDLTLFPPRGGTLCPPPLPEKISSEFLMNGTAKSAKWNFIHVEKNYIRSYIVVSSRQARNQSRQIFQKTLSNLQFGKLRVNLQILSVYTKKEVLLESIHDLTYGSIRQSCPKKGIPMGHSIFIPTDWNVFSRSIQPYSLT